MRHRLFFAIVFFAVSLSASFGQTIKPISPDERFKADILVIVAHPDDETEVTGYLARAIFDEHKRVAVIFGTHGDGGGDATGQEQAAALGAERGIEAVRALLSWCHQRLVPGRSGYTGARRFALPGNLEPWRFTGQDSPAHSLDPARGHPDLAAGLRCW
jgi:hypothetical protein